MTYISFTKSDLADAINAATIAAHTDRQQERVAKAVAWLSSWGGDAWTLKSPVITIRSSHFDTNGEVYTLTLGDGFMEHHCKARKPCWHETLGSIIMAANQLREDREALEYGVWYADCTNCGGQGCPLCMVTVEPAFVPVRPQLAAAVITNECPEEMLSW